MGDPVAQVLIMTGSIRRGLKNILVYAPVFAIVAAAFYLFVRVTLFFFNDYGWHERVLGVLLLLAETFILVHGTGYFLEIRSVLNKKKDFEPRADPVPELIDYPPVAIIMSAYKEPLDVVENTITTFYNLRYPNKRIYFLDDTRYDVPWDTPEKMATYRRSIENLCKFVGVDLFRRTWHGAKAGMINDWLDFIDGKSREGFEFYNFSRKPREEKEKYVIVFDADQNPFPDFVDALVAVMEANPRLAFVQTPQYYTNFEFNRISRAAGLQQVVFYEYICEGKSTKEASFCCGTNVMFRREALMDVGGFDETSVTEDFATSIKFHLKGWKTSFLNRVNAFGMGPEDLGGYFKQQFRWALGTVGLVKTVVSSFLKHRSKLTYAQWWEYLLSSTWYFVGFVFFIMMICPIMFILFDVPAYFAMPGLYLVVFLPYIVVTLVTFYWTLQKRNYRAGDLMTGQLLTFITFPVYMKAVTLALLGVKGQFGITPKGGSMSLPLRFLWPQLLIGAVSFIAMVWGINRLIYEQEPLGGIIANTFWCMYHAIILSAVLYFNRADESRENGGETQ